jgi:hypothetical protein
MFTELKSTLNQEKSNQVSSKGVIKARNQFRSILCSDLPPWRYKQYVIHAVVHMIEFNTSDKKFIVGCAIVLYTSDHPSYSSSPDTYSLYPSLSMRSKFS